MSSELGVQGSELGVQGSELGVQGSELGVQGSGAPKKKKSVAAIVNGAGEELAADVPLKGFLEPVLYKIFRFAPGFETVGDIHRANDEALLALDGIGPTRLKRLRLLCGPPQEADDNG